MEYAFIGLVAGFMAGYFGVGGGAITVPFLLTAGLGIKFAVGISAMQMVFSSVYGSIRNLRGGRVTPSDVMVFGIGGIGGSFLGGNLLHHLDAFMLEIAFLSLIVYALLRVLYSTDEVRAEKPRVSMTFKLIIGVGIGMIAGMLGVGGSILLIPILVGYLHYTTKEAAAVGLFYVMFSSVSAFLTLGYLGYIDYGIGIQVALASLVGVTLGQYAMLKSNTKRHKSWTVFMYIVLFFLTVYEIFFDE